MLSGMPHICFADNMPDFFGKTQISGKIRLYDFTRNYSAPFLPQQTAFALGGNMNILTPDLFFNGLKADADFYTAQSLGLNNSNPDLVDKTLGGPINVLGQVYLQYQYSDLWTMRAGRQLIDTPWINSSDSRMIPNSYEGITISYSPIKNILLQALKINKFKNRTANNFSDINLYNPEAHGDFIKKIGDVRNDGAIGIGASYKNKSIDSALWYYQFYDFSKMIYVDTEYNFSGLSNITPFVGLQALRETGDGKNDIRRYTNTSANATGYGLIGGIKNNFFKLSLGYNNIIQKNNAFKNGDIISPYTAGYATDPLYTTSMIAGMVEKGQGQAIKISGSLFLLDKKLTLGSSYAKYFVTASHDTQEIDADAKYDFTGKLKGFSIRDRVGILYNDPKFNRFIYNRIMVEYKF